jgi:hypothetical protein
MDAANEPSWLGFPATFSFCLPECSDSYFAAPAKPGLSKLEEFDNRTCFEAGRRIYAADFRGLAGNRGLGHDTRTARS